MSRIGAGRVGRTTPAVATRVVTTGSMSVADVVKLWRSAPSACPGCWPASGGALGAWRSWCTAEVMTESVAS